VLGQLGIKIVNNRFRRSQLIIQRYLGQRTAGGRKFVAITAAAVATSLV